LYYGWIIVAAATCIYIVVGGQSVCVGVFIKPIEEDFGWSRAAVTMGHTLYTLTIAFLGVAGGFLVDRYGPRLVVAAGGVLLGLGYYLCAQAESLRSFYITFGFLRGVGFAFVFIPLTVTMVDWFDEKKGLALGILLSGAGFGGLLLTPLIQFWIDTYSWREACTYTSVLIFSVTLLSLLLAKREEKETEKHPFVASNAFLNSEGITPSRTPDHTITEALKSRAFCMFCFAEICVWTGILMALINLVPYATDMGVLPATAALVLAVSNASNAFGRLAVGAISDKIGTKRASSLSLLIGATMMFWLIGAHRNWMLFLFAVLYGVAYGGFLTQVPRFIVELFGKKSMGGIMSIKNVIITIGPALGPVLGAFIYDRTGSYSMAFTIGGLSIFMGFAFILLLKLPEKA